MKKQNMYVAWGTLYVICAALAFIPDPPPVLKGIMVVLSLGFFVPPAMVLYWAYPQDKWGTVRLIRNLSYVSLGLTVAALILNVLSVGTSEIVGYVLHGLLILTSVPMVCGQAWVIGLFGWACLLTVSKVLLKKEKK